MKFLSFTSRLWTGAALVACGASLVPFLSGCGGGNAFAGPLPNPNPSSNANRIAFSSNRDGNFEIYTMNPDGSDVKRVTNNVGDDTKPVWNRDHSKIAFVSERDGNPEIYSVNVVNGEARGEAQRITNNSARDTAPSWNPDGNQLVFESNRDNEAEPALYIVNVGTRIVRRLTQRPGFLDSNPAWSPRGDLIAFESAQNPSTGNFPQGTSRFIFTMKVNGEDVKQVTPDGRRNDSDPAWHPNENKLVFTQITGFLNVVALDLGSGQISNLTPPNQDAYTDPVYSPDGRQIACVDGFAEGEFQNAFTNTEILVLNANDSSETPKRLTTSSTADQDPSW